MRKTYETEATIAAQHRVLNALCRAWRCERSSMTAFSEIDYALTRGQNVLALVEVKTRTNALGAYATYMISAHKIEFGLRWERTFGIPFLLVVEFTDGIYWVKVSEIPFKVEMGGRRDRGDKDDTEIVVHFKSSLMRPLVAAENAA